MAIRTGKNIPKKAPEENLNSGPIVQEKKKTGEKNFVILIFLFALLCAGASVGTVYFVTHSQVQKLFEAQPKPKDFLGPMYDFGEFTTNLLAEGRRYIRVSVTVAFASEKNLKELVDTERLKIIADMKSTIDPLKPVLNDAINTVLTRSTPAQVKGPEGISYLKRELMKALNDKLQEYAPAYEIKEVYLPSIVVQ